MCFSLKYKIDYMCSKHLSYVHSVAPRTGSPAFSGESRAACFTRRRYAPSSISCVPLSCRAAAAARAHGSMCCGTMAAIWSADATASSPAAAARSARLVASCEAKEGVGGGGVRS